ncbi:MAG TPA: hypothetical protein VND93_06735 [Myxococcales bacterium]|nr:hypothetical protein [Myxococcales bacterium]
MKQIRIAVAVLASVLAACGGGGGDPLAGQAGALQVDSPVPMGTFELSGTEGGDVTRLVLMADGTAHLELLSGTIDSYYKQLDPLLGPGHLYLVDDRDTVLYSADYLYDGKVLQLLPDGDVKWEDLAPAPAWCSVASQCEQQWLPQPACLGAWTCSFSQCQFQCKRRWTGTP